MQILQPRKLIIFYSFTFKIRERSLSKKDHTKIIKIYAIVSLLKLYRSFILIFPMMLCKTAKVNDKLITCLSNIHYLSLNVQIAL